MRKLAVRKFPHSTIDFTRFQVGTWATRKENTPIYNGDRIVRWIPTDKDTEVFRLLGWGSTLDKAQRMAERVR